jgi:hypothetical protein
MAQIPPPPVSDLRLCDNSFEDCRQPILDAIDAEPVTGGIDVSMWFMDDFRYVDHLIAAWKRGVPLRVIVDTKADATYPGTKTQRDRMVAAGIPIRRYSGTAINHWKVFIFEAQGKMNFSASNFSNGSYSPIVPYTQYVDEAICFTSRPSIINSFITKFEDRWTNTTKYVDFANMTVPPARKFPVSPIDPDLNFVPDQNYENRLNTQVNLEGANAKFPNLVPKIDAVMFRITSGKIPDALIARAQAGVPIRLINEEQQYRNTAYFWDSYNMDRMYMACAGLPTPPCQPMQLKFKNNTTDQDVHQKSIILYTRALATTPKPMVVFGSSNWTSSSASSQEEHNYFDTEQYTFDWFVQQFERKWNNLKADGTPIGTIVFKPFVPLPPDAPITPSPVNDALGVNNASVTLKWEGGWWAHKYDIYLDTTATFNSPNLVTVTDFAPGSATAGVVSTRESYTVTNLLPATTYYWKIVSKTMANLTKGGPTWHFTTAGGAPVPAAPTGLTATAPSASEVDLSWSPQDGEEGYRIERKLSTDTTYTQIASTAQDVTTYADKNSGLKSNTTYNYRVRAFTTSGASAPSNVVTIKTPLPTVSPQDVVLYAAHASVIRGKYSVTADTTAAGGQRVDNPDVGAVTLSAPLATPASYFELTFAADAGVPYHLWIRGKAYRDSGSNDSAYVQFSDSVNASGAATYRIGSSVGTPVILSDCSGCAVHGWGWNDNGFATMGPNILFANSGTHTIRVQPREDGFEIDQIVLSPNTYLNTSPGAIKDDSVILSEQGLVTGPPDGEAPTVAITAPADGATVGGSVTVNASASDNVGVARVDLWVDGALAQTDASAPYSFTWHAADGTHTLEAHAFDAAGNQGVSPLITVQTSNPPSGDVILFASDTQPTVLAGNWSVVADPTTANGSRVYEQNAGVAKIATALAAPTNYFEMTFNADAGKAYHLWMRMKADNNDWPNDSVLVQFDNSVTSTGTPTFRIGTTSSTAINLEDCSGCGISGWGWQDNGWGVNVFGPDIYFATSGPQTIRVQQREDGVSIDEIVLSPSTYLTSSPGALKNDNTIVR